MTGRANIDGLDEDRSDRAWHAMAAAEVGAAQGVDVTLGLDSVEAERRLSKVGPNELAGVVRHGPLRVLADQFRNLLIVILMVAAVIAGLVGDFQVHCSGALRSRRSRDHGSVCGNQRAVGTAPHPVPDGLAPQH